MRSAFVENICLPFLLNTQNEDGGWGFHAGSMSRAEPTAWALIALLECASTQSHKEAASRAFHFLGAAQLPDGSWPSSPELREGSWVTSLACLALLSPHEISENVTRGLRWLCKELPGEAGLVAPHRAGSSCRSKGRDSERFLFWLELDDRNSELGRATSYAILFLRASSAGIAFGCRETPASSLGKPCCMTACVRQEAGTAETRWFTASPENRK